MEQRKRIRLALIIGALSVAASATAYGNDNALQRSSTYLTLDRYGASLQYAHGRHSQYRRGHRHYRYGYRHRGHRFHNRRYRTYWYYDGYRYRPYRRYYRY